MRIFFWNIFIALWFEKNQKKKKKTEEQPFQTDFFANIPLKMTEAKKLFDLHNISTLKIPFMDK